jgi:hypothetical protein
MVRLRASLQQVGHRSGGRWKGGGGPQGFVSQKWNLEARLWKKTFIRLPINHYCKSQKFNNSGGRKETEKYILSKVCRKRCGIERGIKVKEGTKTTIGLLVIIYSSCD